MLKNETLILGYKVNNFKKEMNPLLLQKKKVVQVKVFPHALSLS